MIVKMHSDKDKGQSIAIFSDCNIYRYVVGEDLELQWSPMSFRYAESLDG
jgi:hypothetical protein